MNANRRNTLGALALGTLASATATAARSAEAGKGRGVVLHVGMNDPDLMSQALNYAANILKHYGDKGETVSVEILANGAGLHMLREDTSPVKGKVMAFTTRNPQVTISACNNTKTNMEAAEGKEIKLMSKARLVPSGVVRLMEAQEAGWSYVWP